MTRNLLFAVVTCALFLVLMSALVPVASAATLFIYHRFGDTRAPSTNVSIADFTAHLQYLHEGGFTVLPVDEIVRRTEAGEILPEKTVGLTVDDGYVTFLTGAMPLLRQYGYPVTLFVQTETVGHRGYLSWEQLAALAAEGVTIGNHGHQHLHFVNRTPGETEQAWRARIRQDIESAQQLFRRQLGLTPTLLAYPYGEYSLPVRDLVRELGFAAAFSQQSGVLDRTADLFAIPRFPIGGVYASLQRFQSLARMQRLPVSAITPVDPVWTATAPPVLELNLDVGAVEVRQLRCYVQGANTCTVTARADNPGSFRVVADKPLAGRRNKYTLTAPLLTGGGWAWYSHLWVMPDRPE
jgi:peptidoglycan/xylan/chitin deacetylase (PgdA/CDA1 family)